MWPLSGVKDQTMNESIASTVAQIREQYGFTQEALARHLGVTFSTVNAWEAGRSQPQPRHRARLQQLAQPKNGNSNALNILISDIVTRRRTATIRALNDASAALNQPIVIHEQPDEVAALLMIGEIKPEVMVFSARRSLIAIEHLAARFSHLPPTQSSHLVILDDGQLTDATLSFPRQAHVILGPLTLADAGTTLREAANRKLVALA